MSRRLLGGTVGAVVLLSSVGLANASAVTLSSPRTSTGAANSGLQTIIGGGLQSKVFRDKNGNYVETVMPYQSSYIPKIAAASQWSRNRAQNLLTGVNHFCATHTAAQIKAHWRPGRAKSSGQTHWFNPNGEPGLHPAHPRAALIYNGRLGGEAFTGKPLPRMGSIPRAHVHDMTMSKGMQRSEMVHVYCTKNLRNAFTPNRQLGVKAATISLREKIRPAVMELNRRQLRHVRHMVRQFCGAKLKPVAPVFPRRPGGPKPVLQAMRTEIRHSLMIMTRHQLRQVWHRMQKYGV